ncbi:MAG: hypothetical protein PVF05_09650 [Gemmatimonadales bacterium]
MKTRKFFPMLAALVVLTACGGDDQADLDREMDLALAEDSLAELADTVAQQPVEQPPAQQQPQAQRPQAQQPSRQPAQQPARQPAQQPAPSGPQMREMTVAAGTSMRVTLDQELSTKTSQVGDVFTTTVSGDVMDGDNVAIPAGAQIRGRVTAVQKSGQPGQAAVLKIAFDEVTVDGETYPVQLTVAEAKPTTVSRSSTGEKVGKIGIGAAAGAILGQVIGGDAKSTIIGGAIGAAAGTAIVLGSADADAVLAEGSPMTLTVDAPITVRREA